MKRDWLRDERASCSRSSAGSVPRVREAANLGSSVGISKAKHVAELRTAIKLAATSIARLWWKPPCEAREIEVAVLGNDDPKRRSPAKSSRPASSTTTTRSIWMGARAR